jgi:4-oxalocrotonate tautomerase
MGPLPGSPRPAIIQNSRGEMESPRVGEEEVMPNITIQWYAGRTDQQKRDITAAITEAMVKIGKTTPDQVQIVFQDIEKSNWGVNGKLASD